MELIKGFDLSTLEEVERCGGVFYRDSKPGDAMTVLRSFGGNYVRLRLWNDPYTQQGEDYGAGVCDLPTVLRLARRAKENAMDWLLDFHYSDFWADPGKQVLPKAWKDYSLEQLEDALYRYTMDVLCACRAAGVVPGMVQVGNEITNGLLWPLGKAPNFDNIAKLVGAGVRAVREFDPQITVMVHLDAGGNNPMYRNWFDNYFRRGGQCDVIGLSYYPQWHGAMEDLESNMQDLAARYHKPMIVVETSTFFTQEDYADHEQLAQQDRKGPPIKPEILEKLQHPVTKQGQLQFLQDLVDIIRRVPDGLGQGFFWWEAAWIPVPGSGWARRGGWEYVHEQGPGGNEWANQALFDYDGNPLPALEWIEKL